MSDACCSHCDAPQLPAGEREGPPTRLREVTEIWLAGAAGVALAIGIAGELAGLHRPAVGGFAGAIVAGGATFVPQAARGLAKGRLGVDTLMAIAAIGAVILGQWGEAATLAFLFSISEALESYALTRTRRGLRALLDLVPDTATVVRATREETIAPDQLQVGDRLIVRPGERVATDGVISSGRSTLDVSAITGESLPVEAGPGDRIFAAAINGGGALEVQVTARSADNSLARIVRIVEEAQERKGRSQRLAERIARPLLPGVLAAAALIAIVGSVAGDPSTWIERALVVLVAAAPCAFAISVPVTVVAAIGAATRSGVLIKGGAALEALAGVRAVAFDKTGTLTRNDPKVNAVLATRGHDRAGILALAAALEARSEHPLAQAILAAGDDVPAADDVEAIPGHGIVGTVGEAAVRLGRPGFVDTGPFTDQVADLQDGGATVVLLARNGKTIGAIAVRDELRPEAFDALRLLAGERIGKIVMVSGDNRRTAEAIGRQAGVSTIHAELAPEDKVTVIERLQHNRRAVAMVGDGINDAPALASADVGVAMGAIGADVAIEAADVALMGDDLRHLPDTFAHAHRAGRIMRQNLALSGAILLSLIPLAATGVLGLAAVVAIHELAEVIVIANGVRAGRRIAFRNHPPLQALLSTEPAPRTSHAARRWLHLPRTRI